MNRNGHGVAGDLIVPFSLPGDEVDLTIRGREVVAAVPVAQAAGHAAPACPHFGWTLGACGGCVLQHLGLTESGEWKRERVVRALRDVIDIPPTIAVDQVAPQSRRRARLGFRRHKGKWAFGFRRYRSHDLVPMTACAVLSPAIWAAATALGDAAATAWPRPITAFDAHVTEASNGLDIQLSGLSATDLDPDAIAALSQAAERANILRIGDHDGPVLSFGSPVIDMEGVAVPLPPASFLQASVAGEAALVRSVLDGCTGARRVADLFCGLGTFALRLAGAATVTAVDSDGPAIAALKRVAPSRGIDVRQRDLFADPLSPDDLNRFDAVVVDPPRAGARAQFACVAESNVPRVVAVSCNPDTLARDLAALAPRYDVTHLKVVDQFLWSSHIEVVATLRRR